MRPQSPVSGGRMQDVHVKAELPHGWVPEGAFVHVFARRDRSGRWETLLPEFTIAGMGPTLEDARRTRSSARRLPARMRTRRSLVRRFPTSDQASAPMGRSPATSRRPPVALARAAPGRQVERALQGAAAARRRLLASRPVERLELRASQASLLQHRPEDPAPGDQPVHFLSRLTLPDFVGCS